MISKLNRFTILILMFVFVIILSINFSSPGIISNWELVYENSSSGNKISGDLDQLITSAMNGSDIKVMLHFHSAELHYQMQLSKVRVNLKDRIVSGYNFDFRQNTSENNVYDRISTYSTSGEYISMYEENNYYKSPEVINVSMSWYVNK